MHDICVDESWQWQCLPSPKQMTRMKSSGDWKEQPQHIIQDSGGMKVRLCVSCKGRRNQATWPQSRVILDTLDRTGIYHVLGSGFILLDTRSLPGYLHWTVWSSVPLHASASGNQVKTEDGDGSPRSVHAVMSKCLQQKEKIYFLNFIIIRSEWLEL